MHTYFHISIEFRVNGIYIIMYPMRWGKYIRWVVVSLRQVKVDTLSVLTILFVLLHGMMVSVVATSMYTLTGCVVTVKQCRGQKIIQLARTIKLHKNPYIIDFLSKNIVNIVCKWVNRSWVTFKNVSLNTHRVIVDADWLILCVL